MMYIRTKDGVYEVSSKQKNTYYVLNGRWQFEKQDIIKQSENLEELCDCFKTVSDYAGQLIITHYFDFEQARFNKSDEAELYGYIYIILSNGAIRIEPIAKMNDKGELELI